jgi:hypothetical protein
VSFRGKQTPDGNIEPKANPFNSGLGCLICVIFYRRAGLSFLSLLPALLGFGAHFLFRNIDLPSPFTVANPCPKIFSVAMHPDFSNNPDFRDCH